MRKWLIFAAVLCGIGFLMKRFAPQAGKIDWEKKLAAMPDNAPPKWMFGNITAIRENTDRILDLLQHGTADDGVPADTPGGAPADRGSADARGGNPT
jgi:hypothetical protein